MAHLRIWRIYVKELQEADRPWETPDHEEMSELPQLTGVSLQWKPKTGIGVEAIHPSMSSRISEKGQQLCSALLNDVERTLTWPAQIQTLTYFLVPKTPT